MHRGDVLRQRRIAEPQFDRAEARARAVARLRRRARRHRPSGRGRSCCRRGSACGVGAEHAAKRLPARLARARPSRRRRSRPSPCARCPARRSGRSARRARPTAPTGSSRSPLVSVSISPSRLAIAGCGRTQIAEQIGAAGHALLGLEVDQQQAAPCGRRRGWCRARSSAAPRPGVAPDGAHGEDRQGSALGMKIPRTWQPSHIRPRAADFAAFLNP